VTTYYDGPSPLLRRARPAEVRRGLRHCITFRDAADVAEQYGTLTGSPTFSDDGLVIDGSTQYAAFPLAGWETKRAAQSWVVEFVPDFDADEDATRTLLAFGTASATSIVRGNAAASNALTVTLYGAAPITIAYATWVAAWLPAARNVLTVSAISGTVGVYLNGTTIATAATAFTAETSAVAYVGASAAGADLWSGSFSSVRLFAGASALSAYEADDYYDQTTDLPAPHCELPMLAAQVSGSTTLDVSGNGYHGTVTGATKRTERGYSFDGTNDCITLPAASFPPGTAISFTFLLRPIDVATTSARFFSTTDTGGDEFRTFYSAPDYVWYWDNTAGTLKNCKMITGGGTSPRVLRAVTVTMRFDGSNTLTTTYENGTATETKSNVLQWAAPDTSVNLGCWGTDYAETEILYYRADNRALTQTQVIELHADLMRRIHEV